MLWEAVLNGVWWLTSCKFNVRFVSFKWWLCIVIYCDMFWFNDFCLCNAIWIVSLASLVNTLRPRQNGGHFIEDIFKCLFNEIVWTLISMSLIVVRKGPINNIPALVQIKAWRPPGNNPLSKPLIVILLTHICVTRPQQGNVLCH